MKVFRNVGLVVLALACCCLLPGSTPARAGNPLGTLVRGRFDAVPLRGRVEQRLSAGGYTYLALRTADDQLHWAVTLGRGAPPGAKIAVRSMGHRAQFYSRRLRRTFPDLVFGIVTQI